MPYYGHPPIEVLVPTTNNRAMNSCYTGIKRVFGLKDLCCCREGNDGDDLVSRRTGQLPTGVRSMRVVVRV